VRGRVTGLAVALWALPLVVWAAEDKVSVKADVVLVSNSGSEVQPPELSKMKESFQRQGFNFTSYKRLSQQTLQLTREKPTEVKLPNGVNASLKLTDMKDGSATVRVDVPRLGATDVRLGKHGSVYQLAGDHVGGKLVLVLTQP
jgi:hypothetical protein